METRTLFIAHSIFLEPEEQKKLQEIGGFVEVIGVSVPIWIDGTKTNEPAKEVFCKYKIWHADCDVTEAIRIEPDGYYLALRNGDFCTRLLDVKDGGCGGVVMVGNGTTWIEELEYPVCHQVSILNRGTLDRSMYFVQRDQTASK